MKMIYLIRETYLGNLVNKELKKLALGIHWLKDRIFVNEIKNGSPSLGSHKSSGLPTLLLFLAVITTG